MGHWPRRGREEDCSGCPYQLLGNDFTIVAHVLHCEAKRRAVLHHCCLQTPAYSDPAPTFAKR